MPTFRRRAVLALAAALPLARPAVAQAGFPNRPIRLIVPWPPGGTADTQLRVLGEIAAKKLGQPVLVENKPGASRHARRRSHGGRRRAPTATCSARCRSPPSACR